MDLIIETTSGYKLLNVVGEEIDEEGGIQDQEKLHPEGKTDEFCDDKDP